MATRLGGVLLVLVAAKALAAAPDAAPANPLDQAKAEMRVLTGTVQSIERIGALTVGRAVRTSCVDEKLAEARAGVQIGNGEVAVIVASLEGTPTRAEPVAGPAAGRSVSDRPDAEAKRRAEDVEHALTRLTLLAERARGLIRAARVCADEDRGAVSVTRVEVQIAPVVPGGDPTALPPPRPVTPERPAER